MKNEIFVNNCIHGFRVLSVRKAEELSATAYEMIYEKNGAKLLWLDRPDENKTFSIAFRTVPEDDTGVFHILEHSVLCGSEKYPSKDPFVELLKGSVKTFLNAFTFPDKTVYPVSSRNEKDFLNLTSVYLDAVFHPNLLHKPEIFRQEGWHLEPNREDGSLSCQGVVLNEMRGAYSSPDELAVSSLASLLYADTVYSKESGGEPTAIPSLTYERFCAAHKKFYHPSNALLFLDGKIDLDKTLALLDSYLSAYDAAPVDFPIRKQEPKEHRERTVAFELAPGQPTKNQARLCCGMLISDYDDREKNLALAILIDVLAGTNEAPFKQRMLASGLCEDADLFPYNGILQNSLCMELYQVDEKNLKKAEALAKKTLADIAKEGLDRESLNASFNRLEFSTRERDFGSYPKGIVYNLSVLESWLYGGDPIEPLLIDDIFSSLRKKKDDGYFDALLSEIASAERGTATVYLLPDPDLGEKRAAREKEEMRVLREKMSEEDYRKVLDEEDALLLWQKTEDSEEILDKLPKLAIEDISDTPEEIPSEERTAGGVPMLYHAIPTEGIVYANLFFDLTGLSAEEIYDLSCVVALLSKVHTEHYTTFALQNAIKSELGSLAAEICAFTKKGVCTPYLKVSVSALDSKKEGLLSLLSEVLLRSRFDEKEAIRNVFRQGLISLREGFTEGGSSYAITRAGAYLSPEMAVFEYTGGYECYLRIKKTVKNFSRAFPGMEKKYSTLLSRVLVKNRLFFSVTGKEDESFFSSLAGLFPESALPFGNKRVEPLGVRREAILIPAQVGYAGMCAVIENADMEKRGGYLVARSILSFAYLWNRIRVLGGAYGAGFGAKLSGVLTFYSYRDPKPAGSVNVFRDSGDFLRRFAKENNDLTKYIIGAVGDADTLYTPRTAALMADVYALRGIGKEDLKKERAAMLKTTQNTLLRIADEMDKALLSDAFCLVAGKEKIDEAGDMIRTVLEL